MEGRLVQLVNALLFDQSDWVHCFVEELPLCLLVLVIHFVLEELQQCHFFAVELVEVLLAPAEVDGLAFLVLGVKVGVADVAIDYRVFLRYLIGVFLLHFLDEKFLLGVVG